MKKLTKFIGITLLAALTFSCSNDDSNQKTIAEIAQSSPNLSILVDALVKTGLAETFDSAGSYTVFAPTNDQFEDFLTANGFATLDDVPVDLLTEVLKNHVLAGTFYSTDISTGYVKTLAKGSASDSNNLSMYINVTEEGVIINGGNTNGGGVVTAYDLKASNGVIHVVDGVLGLPTVVNHAVANPNFTTLVSLVGGAGLVPTLNGTVGSPFTVFAPTNAAFATFESQNPGVLASLTSTQVTSVLTYHVVGGANVLSTGIPTTPITTLETGTFTISGTTITDEANRQTSIVAVDVQGSNGVIHVINNVLLPSL